MPVFCGCVAVCACGSWMSAVHLVVCVRFSVCVNV